MASLERRHTARSRSARRRTRRGRGRLPSTAVTGEPPTWSRPSPSLSCRGFELLGPARRVCGTNGTWSPQGIPFCGEDEEAFFHLFHVFSVLPYRQFRVQVYIVNLYKISSKEVSTFPFMCRYHLWDIILSPNLGNTKNSTCFYVLF